MADLRIDTNMLERDGFVVIRQLVPEDDLATFEQQVHRFAQSQLEGLGRPPLASEAFVDVFSRGGAYTDRLYVLLERLWILNRMTTRIVDQLEESRFLEWAEIEVPLIWPDIRADIPHDSTRTLPVHQDYASMKCRRAWRLWIPLRPTNATLGSMIAYPGTHRNGVVEHQFDDTSKPAVDPSTYDGIEPVVMDLPAGDGVLLNPLCLHASVQNRSARTKFTLMVQIQDYTTLIDPDDDAGEFARLKRFAAGRQRVDAAADR